MYLPNISSKGLVFEGRCRFGVILDGVVYCIVLNKEGRVITVHNL